MNVKELAEKIYEIGLPLNRADTISATESILTTALEEAYQKGGRKAMERLDTVKFIEESKAAAHLEGFKQGQAKADDVFRLDWEGKIKAAAFAEFYAHPNLACQLVKKAAYEDCAKIARGPKSYTNGHITCMDDTGENIATQIRAKADEVGK